MQTRWGRKTAQQYDGAQQKGKVITIWHNHGDLFHERFRMTFQVLERGILTTQALDFYHWLSPLPCEYLYRL